MEITLDIIYFWLSSSPLNVVKKQKLLENFDPFELFDRVGKDKKINEFLGEAHTLELQRLKNKDVLMPQLEAADKNGVKYININDERYPNRLKDAQVNPPPLLFYKGDLSILDTACIGVVGTRNASRYGKEVTETLTAECCEYGITVVSGMALGIDAYAHEAVLNAGGKTVAVLGSGLNKPTPLANYNLFERLTKCGLVVSEYAPELGAYKYTFPERNRIIAGLSNAVVVTEAATKSGSLITADLALEAGIEVFAVPGNITSAKSAGTNNLIKSGARVLTSVKDVLSFLNYQNTKINKIRSSIALDIYEEKLYNLLQNQELSIDQLKESTDFSFKELLGILFSLEMKGIIKRQHGNIYRIEVK